MAEKEKLHISASALVELKATLFSKQREVQSQTKKRNDGTAVSTKTVSEKTAAIWRRPQKRGGRGVSARELQRERATQRSAEEEAELERSRKALEAKAALYDRLCGGEGVTQSDSEGEEEEGRYMVDFTRKIIEERNAQKPASSSSSLLSREVELEEEKEKGKREGGGAEEVGEWVEYVDPFGRTRRCPKEDLPSITSSVTMSESVPEAEKKRRERSATPDLLSDDMAMERERRRWEAEEEEKVEKSSGPTHYQEMRQGEVRTHGVGYYAFSQEEEKRTEQLNLLNKLRDQTVNQREKKAKLQEKRKAQMAARLEKVRQRKQIKQPQPVPQETEEVEKTEEEAIAGGEGEAVAFDPIAAMIDSELGQARERAEKEVESETTTKPNKPYVRPWDKGKAIDPIRKRKKELEDERLNEFAPPSSYYKTTSGTTSTPKVTKVDSLEPNSSGVVPPGDHSRLSSSDGVGDAEKIQNSSNPPHPPPFIQPPFFNAPYPYPPNAMFAPPMVPLFGPPPPPPVGPILPNSQPQRPSWYPQYFNPPPPPPTALSTMYQPPTSSS